MAVERTLAMIKPDAVAKDFIGNILALIEEKGLHIIAAKMMQLTVEQAAELYAEHKGRPFYEPLLEYMTSGPIMLHVIEGENAIRVLRETIGATIPDEAAAGTIRNLYANHQFNGIVHENAIHGSDSTDSARKEIDFFFGADEIYRRT